MSSQSNQLLSKCMDIITEFHDPGRGNASDADQARYNDCVEQVKSAAKHHDGVADMDSGLAVYAFATPFILIIGNYSTRALKKQYYVYL